MSAAKTAGGGLPTQRWPSLGDYSDAIQNPWSAFVDPHLRECDPERKGPARIPWVRAGAFAGVFRLNHPQGRSTAVRVFAPQALDPLKEERLVKIAAHLNGLGAKKPGYFVEFGYHRQGIRIKGAAFPIQTMAWVQGVTLGNWYQARMRAKDYAAVRDMAAKWQKMVIELRQLQIAHGDLQHGNVMVRPDNTPVLVDYDGMCVPSLVTNPPQDCFECGLAGYVHPKRPKEKLGLELDRFPAWIILIALRASAADPSLFQKFVEEPESETMLFSSADLDHPEKSKLWPELLKFKDPEVQAWAKDLRASLDKPFAQIPPFQTDPFAELGTLCAANPTDWEAVQIEADRLATGGKPPPPALLPKVTTARKKVTTRNALRDAFAAARTTGDPRALASLFDASVFADWPKQGGFMSQVEGVVKTAPAFAELARAADAKDDGRSLLVAWDKVKDKFANSPKAQEYGKKAEEWRGRIAAADAFIAVPQTAADSAVAAAWRRVKAAGLPHPSLTPAHRDRGEKSLQRADLLAKLGAVLPAPSEAGDKQLVALWNPAVLNGCPEAAPFAAKVSAARGRLDTLTKVADAVRRADAQPGNEGAVVSAAAALPPEYTFDLKVRVARAKVGEEQFAGLKALLAQAAPSDIALATEWDKLRQQHPAQAALVQKPDRDRCELAVRRRSALKVLDDLIDQKNLDPHQRDLKLATLWASQKALLDESADNSGDRQNRVRVALVRLQCLSRLEKAVREQDVATIREAAAPRPLPKFALYPPVVALRPQIDALVSLATWLDDLNKKLGAAGKSAGLPLTADDLTKLRQHGQRLDPNTRAAVTKCLNKSLWPAIKLAPSSAPPEVKPGVVRMAKVKWSWTGPDLVSWFEIAADTGPLTDPATAQRARTSKCRPQDHAGDGGGRWVALGADKSVMVTIWPVLDLGWVTLHGPPIHVGPIRG